MAKPPGTGKKQRAEPWKKIYGRDRKYTARVDRAMQRGQYTPPKEDSP